MPHVELVLEVDDGRVRRTRARIDIPERRLKESDSEEFLVAVARAAKDALWKRFIEKQATVLLPKYESDLIIPESAWSIFPDVTD